MTTFKAKANINSGSIIFNPLDHSTSSLVSEKCSRDILEYAQGKQFPAILGAKNEQGLASLN
jgi:hypothetical protein